MINRQAGWRARSSRRQAWHVPCMAARRELQGGGGTLWLASGGSSDADRGRQSPTRELHSPPSKADAGASANELTSDS